MRIRIFAGVLLALALVASAASAQTVTWERKALGQGFNNPCGNPFNFPSNNNWSQDQHFSTACDQSYMDEPSNWTTSDFPNSTTVDVVIPASQPVRLDLGVTVGTLQLGSGASLFMAQSSLTIAEGVLQNDGVITVKNNHGASFLTFATDATISGAGEIAIFLNGLSDAGAQIVTSGAATLTQQAGHRIRGIGNLKAKLINNGLVSSDAAVDAGNFRTLDLGAYEMTNNATFQAIDGHTLALNNTIVSQSASAQMLANNGVVAFHGATVSGGTFNASNGGTFGGGHVTMNNVTNNAPMAVGNYVLNGTLVNNNTMSVLGNPYHGAITAGSNTTVSGTGKFTMTQEPYSFIDAAAGATLTQSAGHTIEGMGTITAPLVNNGTVLANNRTLVLNQGDKTNNALMQVNVDASLRFEGVTVNQGANGIIRANGGSVGLFGANNKNTTVTGGTLESTNGGTFSAGGVNLFGVNNNAVYHLSSTGIGAGPLINNGEFNIHGNPGLGFIEFMGDVTVSGTGVIASRQFGYSLMKVAQGFTLTNDGGHTISGNGLIRGKIVNKANIVPSEGRSLEFLGDQGGSDLRNEGGNISVPANTGLFFQNGVPFSQSAGVIRLTGGTIGIPNGIDITGGQLVGSGTIDGAVRNSGGTVAPGLSPGKITINGNYTQGENGVLALEIGGTEAGTGYDQLRVNGTATLGGTLNIKLINGFQPQKGDVFEIIDPNAVSGAFAKINAEGFSVQANYAAGAITITVTDPPDKLLNISTRLRVGTGENALIGGFIITGTEAKKVIVRAVGPSLGSQGVAGVLANPTLELFDASGSLAFNDNWKDDQQGEIEASTVAPGNGLEAAIVRTLQPGNYTAVVRGAGETTGIGLVEVYDLAQGVNAKLANISSRGFVETGENVLIGGLIVGGGGGGTRVVVRAIGPSLGAAGVEGVLQDPALQLVDANGSEISANDNWKDGQRSELEALQIGPASDLEAALIANLSGGNYTAVVRGNNGGTGVGLVEVYNVQ